MSHTKTESVIDSKNIWTKEQEELLAEWADIASCYNWMHSRGEQLSANKNTMITVPVIILSTLSGSANFILSSLATSPANQTYGQIMIGCVSIFTGVLTTLGNFFRYAQNSEANRGAAISWGKLHRNISVELALHPEERIDSAQFVKSCRVELDRLIEQSPNLPQSIIKEFEKEFKDTPTLKRPDIAHGLEHTRVYLRPSIEPSIHPLLHTSI